MRNEEFHRRDVALKLGMNEFLGAAQQGVTYRCPRTSRRSDIHRAVLFSALVTAAGDSPVAQRLFYRRIKSDVASFNMGLIFMRMMDYHFTF